MRDIYYTCISTLANGHLFPPPFAFPLRPPLAVAYGLPVVPQTKQQKVNNLEATDERATNADAQHAAHMG